MNSPRKLAAILAADVVGYSRLVGLDEEGTLQRLRDLRNELIDPATIQHRGRVVKTMGDGFLIEFASAVDAVRCAVDIQRGTKTFNTDSSEDRRIELRVGINVGDVVIEGDDLLGDGMNVAVRLEGIAKPGGICISDSAYQQVRDKLEIDFTDIGLQTLKNIARPVQAYRIHVDSRQTKPSDDPPLPDKPSLAVLPFVNLSGDPEQEYFADGVVDDIISALSRVRAFFVIARNSSFSYKGKSPDVRQVGRELGVRYVLEGSIRRAGNRVRIVGQLIEAENGRHIWADRFEGNLNDIFELQDQITESVAGAIEPNLRLAEIERARSKPTANLHAYDLCLRAMPNLISIGTKQQNDEALALLYRAIEMDPAYSYAKALCAWAYVARKSQTWATAAEMQEGLRLAEEALADHRDDPATLTYAGHALSYLGFRHDDALRAIDRALALNPNSTRILRSAGWIRQYVGDATIATEHFRRAIRLNPLDPEMHSVLCGLGFSYLVAGKYDEALSAGQKSLQESPTWIPAHRLVVVCLVEVGRLHEARVAANRMIDLVPDINVSAIGSQLPYKDEAFKQRHLTGLRLAGIPE